MPDALFEAVRKLKVSSPPANSVDFSSLRLERETCRQAFLSQKEEPYAFSCGPTPVRLFFDAQGTPLDALIQGYLRAVFLPYSLPDFPADADISHS